MPRGKRAEARSRYLVRAIAEKRDGILDILKGGEIFLKSRKLRTFSRTVGCKGISRIF